MSNESSIPQQLMKGALLHFESGVPIADLDVRCEHKDRLARVAHVYWQFVKNPFLDTFSMFKQLVKGKGADVQSEWHMAQKDKWLFDFVVERVMPSSRRTDERKVRAAAEKAIMIGMETDNVQALTKGGKLLYDVAGLDKPENEQADMSKVAFLPSVVVTRVSDVDPDKIDYSDEETKRIMQKYGAHIDEKRTMVEEQVALMEARKSAAESTKEDVQQE